MPFYKCVYKQETILAFHLEMFFVSFNLDCFTRGSPEEEEAVQVAEKDIVL